MAFFIDDLICVVSAGAWLPLQGCVTEAQQKTDVWQPLEMTLH